MSDRKLNKGTEEQTEAEKLDLGELEQVTGGDNPFANIPRNPDQPIDPIVRDNG